MTRKNFPNLEIANIVNRQIGQWELSHNIQNKQEKQERLASGDVRELILATSATVEGEATAAFLAGIAARAGVLASRIAHGVPMGGELEFVDSSTLSLALAARTAMHDE